SVRRILALATRYMARVICLMFSTARRRRRISRREAICAPHRLAVLTSLSRWRHGRGGAPAPGRGLSGGLGFCLLAFTGAEEHLLVPVDGIGQLGLGFFGQVLGLVNHLDNFGLQGMEIGRA